MTETARDAKLVQYLSEAYGKEKELETALQAHIPMTTRKPYKKRLQDHLKETKGHARELERRIKKLNNGGGPALTAQIPSQVAQVVGKAKAVAEGPIDTIRGGTGENEQMLKNAKKEYWNEHEEIAGYTAIETLAESVNDKETAKLARNIRREEERMAKFLEGQIKTLTKAVATEEIPAKERRSSSSRNGTRRSSSSTRKRASSSSSRKRSSATGKRTTSGATRRRASSSSSRSRSSRSTSRPRARSGSGSRSRRS